MRPHPRIRKTIKWGGLVLTVLLAVVWIGSGWSGVAWYGRPVPGQGSVDVAVNHGVLAIGYCDPAVDTSGSQLGFNAWRNTPWELHAWYTPLDMPSTWGIGIPLWCLALLTSWLASLAWRWDRLARRRARLNLCPTGGCRYDRTGLASPNAPCPECGLPPPAPPPRA